MIFVRRLPRNASSSIESVCDNVLRERIPLIEYRSKIKDWDEALIFAVIRNPYDRVVSMYHWIRRDMTFDFFVNSLVERRWYNEEQLWHTEPQFPYITINGKIPIKIIRFEHLEEDFEKLNTGIELPHLNKSKRTHYKDYLTKDTKKIIETVYADDFRIFKP
jgi:hypothetical protein